MDVDEMIGEVSCTYVHYHPILLSILSWIQRQTYSCSFAPPHPSSPLPSPPLNTSSKCSASFTAKINRLSAPVDVYCDWMDECERANAAAAETDDVDEVPPNPDSPTVRP